MNNEQVPALRQAVESMANMREAYDNLSQAAEAYNVGKVQLAEAITSKGVDTLPTETYPEMAEKVNAISQETYQINGGEMYAKQLFGSLETPNYWNLYDVLAQLLSDGRLVSYGGIVLGEYNKGYNTIALSGAGAGGAYVVSDLDENGQFKMYTTDATHTWNDDLNMKGNRFVAYCFAEEGHEFVISDADTCPRSIFIGRHVGIVRSTVSGRVSELVVPNGNTLDDVRLGTRDQSQNWNKYIVIDNIKRHATGYILGNVGNAEHIYLGIDDVSSQVMRSGVQVSSLIFDGHGHNWSGHVVLYGGIPGGATMSAKICIIVNVISSGVTISAPTGVLIFRDTEVFTNDFDNPTLGDAATFKRVYFLAAESGEISMYRAKLTYIYMGYKTNDRTKSVKIGTGPIVLQPSRMELKEGYRKSINFSAFSALPAECLALDILDKLADNTGESVLTITMGSNNLNRILADETYAPYVAAAQAKNYTIA